MIKFVGEGLKASTIKVKAFRIVIKLTEDLTVRVKGTRPLVVNNRGPNRKVTPSKPKGQVNDYKRFENLGNQASGGPPEGNKQVNAGREPPVDTFPDMKIQAARVQAA